MSEPWDVPEELAEITLGIFGERFELARQFAQLLAVEGIEWGLLGPREIPRLWDRHIVNSVSVSEFISPSAVVVDVGSGAGLPGIALAIARPDLRIDLVEPMERRTIFLNVCVERLRLEGVRVIRARGEEYGAKARKLEELPDYVTCRAVSPLASLIQMASSMVPPAVLLAIKGGRAGDEIARARKLLQSRGLVERVRVSAVDGYHLGTVVEVVRKGAGSVVWDGVVPSEWVI